MTGVQTCALPIFVRLVQTPHGLLQVDDVDPVAFREDVGLHLGVPAPRLVPEVHAALQQLFHAHNCHFFNLPKVKPPPGALIEAPRSRAPPEGGMRNTFAAPRRMCVIDNTKDSISKSSDFEDSFRLLDCQSKSNSQIEKGFTRGTKAETLSWTVVQPFYNP